MPVADEKAVLEQVDRVLQSEELRGSEVLCRLLKFLMDKHVSGEADDLKEYIVAIDGLGKPASYDPRHNSAVRIQARRLRQKLADYYCTHGTNDPIVIDVPKGGFKLQFSHRASSTAVTHPLPFEVNADVAELTPVYVPPDPPAPKGPVKAFSSQFSSSMLLRLGLVIALAIGWFLGAKPWRVTATNSPSSVLWCPALEELWSPILNSSRPLVVVIEDPLFVEIRHGAGIYYRDKSINSWARVVNSTVFTTLRRSLNNPDIQASQYYTAFGEANASFQVGKLLGPRKQNLFLLKASDVTWQQLADNNILFVGVQNVFFHEQMQAMPIDVQFLPVAEGIRNLHPRQGEPAIFADQYSMAPSEAGVAYALVTHLPGPLGGTEVESFASGRSGGYVAAVQSFTDPQFAHLIVENLKKVAQGKMPRYYQVVLRVKFQNAVPIETKFVLSRQLQ
jgi:hypothetical protein